MKYDCMEAKFYSVAAKFVMKLEQGENEKERERRRKKLVNIY
jgi:hypothetical protein